METHRVRLGKRVLRECVVFTATDRWGRGNKMGNGILWVRGQ